MLNTVIIPVYNQAELTRRCLESLLEHTSPKTRRLCLIDNASTDATPQLLKVFAPRFAQRGWDFGVTTNPKNVGFGRAMNQGVEKASTPFITLLNNDTWLMRRWDEPLLDRIKALKLDMISPFVLEGPFVESQIGSTALAFCQRNRGKVRAVWNSILMLFRRASFEQVGRFDERFFVTYEDTDLQVRMRQAGMTTAQVADCFIWHRSKGTRDQGGLPSSYELEGKRLFMDKWGFDPARRAARPWEKLKRSWQKAKAQMGYF